MAKARTTFRYHSFKGMSRDHFDKLYKGQKISLSLDAAWKEIQLALKDIEKAEKKAENVAKNKAKQKEIDLEHDAKKSGK